MEDTVSGCLFIVAAPSGGGKTSLVRQLISDLKAIDVSVSHTTRAKRPAEQDGVDYYFIEEDEFLDKVAAGEFVEYAKVYNHYYGTSKAQIRDRLKAGIDVVLDIDWQGAQQIKKIFEDAVGIFIIPPSLEVLKQRLLDRQQDADAVISDRMQRACDELGHYSEFDYLIVNDEFNVAAAELKSIIITHRLNLKRQSVRLGKLLSFLLTSK